MTPYTNPDRPLMYDLEQVTAGGARRWIQHGVQHMQQPMRTAGMGGLFQASSTRRSTSSHTACSHQLQRLW